MARPEVLVVTETRREMGGQWGWSGKEEVTYILDVGSLGLCCGLDMGDEGEGRVE